jgi:phage terminase large subunit-like protein
MAAKNGNGTAIARWRNDPVAFIEQVLIDPDTKKPFRLYEAQRRFLAEAFRLTDNGRLVHNELLFSGPKKLGKSTYSAMIAIYVAVCLAGVGGEIWFLANDAEQSMSRGFRIAAQILRASPLLRGAVDISATRITFRATGTTMTAVANDYAGFSGANPSLNVYDELAYFNSESSRRLWDEGIPSPARRISLRLATSTAGFDGEPSPLRDLYDRAMTKGREIGPDLREHENLLCYWRHEPVPEMHPQWWLDQQAETLRPVQFRRLIRNEWTSSEAQFINLDDWDKCTDPELRPLLADRNLAVFAGLDCSIRGDFTALAVCTFDLKRNAVRVVTHKLFKPQGGDISFAAVEQQVTEISERFELKGCYYDPYQAESMAQRLRAAGINMVAFPQTPANLEAAASNLLTLVSERNIVSYPSDELRGAISNCRSIETVRGFRISKIVGSRKIDLAAALSFAALAAVKEGAKPEPGAGIIGYYKLLNERGRQEQATKQYPAPPGLEIVEPEVDDSLTGLYERTLAEAEGRGGCYHCGQPLGTIGIFTMVRSSVFTLHARTHGGRRGCRYEKSLRVDNASGANVILERRRVCGSRAG